MLPPRVDPPAVLVAPLRPVCGCESSGDPDKAPTQYDADGNVLHGRVNPNDIGMCQINVQPKNGNIQQAEKLGLDVYTEQGNIKMANWLYAHQGLTPWDSSKSCWDK